jgi:hypothetical protein
MTMHPQSGNRKVFGPGNWYTSFVLFLAFLLPVSPLLAEIQQDFPSRDSTKASTSESLVNLPQRYISSYFVALDLFGQRPFMELDSPPSFMGTDTKACDKGRSDADWETDGTLWFILGVLLTIWGPVLAYVITPSVPESHLKGKSAAYASSYSDCYKQVAKAIHVKWAWYGLGAVALAAGLALIIVLLANTGMSN